MMRALTIVLLLCALAGCGGAPAVPDFTYYRLPSWQRLPPSESLSQAPIVVESFSADGLYADQALIYALDADAQALRQYHYQLWTDPPTRVLQRRLIAQLRETQAAPLVTDTLPASRPAMRIRGIILRFDRVPGAHGGQEAVVALKLRADAGDGTPLIDDYYRAEVSATDTSMKATVDAYGAALDTIFARFQSDLRAHGARPHAG
jgi:cholesterol transport system auxiliary component